MNRHTKNILVITSVATAGIATGVVAEKVWHTKHTSYLGNLRIDKSDGEERLWLEVIDAKKLRTANEVILKVVRENYVRK